MDKHLHFSGDKSIIILERLVLGLNRALEESDVERLASRGVLSKGEAVKRETGFGVVEHLSLDVDADETGKNNIVGAVDPVAGREQCFIAGIVVVAVLVLLLSSFAGKDKRGKSMDGELIKLESRLHQSREEDTIGTADIDDRVGTLLSQLSKHPRLPLKPERRIKVDLGDHREA